MPVVAEQHGAGHPFAHDTDFRPTCAWPDDARVQWGSGRSFARYGAPDTGSPAFFEAFLADDASVLIRGEAPDIAEAEAAAFAEAEAAAFAKFRRYLACDGHDWIRQYTEESGVGCCSRCGARGSSALPVRLRPIPTDGPLSPRELETIGLGLLHGSHMGRNPDLGRHGERSAAIRSKAARDGIDLPDPFMEEEDYDAACAALVGALWAERRSWYEDHARTLPPPGRHESAYMCPLVTCGLDDLARKHLATARAPGRL